MKEKRVPMGQVLAIVLLVLSIIMMLGIKLVFHACNEVEVLADGTRIYPTCHWAQEMVFFISIIAVVLCTTMVGVRDYHMKMALSIAMFPTMVVAAVTPGNAVDLCTDTDKYCQSIMRPAVIVASVIIIVVAIAAATVQYKEAHHNDKKH